MTNDSSHVLFAVSNIDDQMRKEQEYSEKLNAEKIIARTDGLTGKLNKYSYNELERKINKNIENGTIDDFSIIVCDLNNLKLVNDTLGHEAGDEYIKDGANLLQKHFKNSSVFRIGGDEFAIIIDNSEFYIRDFLLERLNKENHQNKKLGRVTLALGMSDFDKETDTSLAQVFKRADDKMYQYKKEFKSE
jgi:diguanylate cyclase (GGDEF)-like protein